MEHGQQSNMQYQQNVGNCNQCGSYTELYDGICRNCKQRLFTVQQIELFEKHISCCNQQFMFIKNYRNQKSNLLKICNSTAKIKLTIGVILTVLYLFFCIALGDIEAIAGFTIMAFPFIGYFYASYYEHSKKKAEANKQLNILEMNYNNALGDIARVYENSTKFLPLKYSSPDISNDLKEILVNKRAFSIQEALNVYETDLYQNRMLMMQAGMQDKLETIQILSAINTTASVITAYNTRR